MSVDNQIERFKVMTEQDPKDTEGHKKTPSASGDDTEGHKHEPDA